ncbi:MAG: hypothetical protein AAF362_15720 [Pseudomonadota bacterium]
MNRFFYALFGGLVGFALGLGAMLIYLNYFAHPPAPQTIIRYDTQRAIELQEAEDQAQANSREETVPLLPRQPEGVTVMNKRDESRLSPEPTIEIPQTGEAATATGYGINLGSAASFSALSRRFAEISEANAEMLLDQLEPRASLKDTEDGLSAQLMIGPFATLQEAQQACANIALPAEIVCIAEKFEGELIERQ